MNITTLLDQQCQVHSQQPAIIDSQSEKDPCHRFAELYQDNIRIAALLKAYDIQTGDVVLVLYPMSYELYVVLTALFRLGAVAMFLDPSAGLEHIRQCCDIGQPKALVASHNAHLLRLISPALRRIPVKFSTSRWVPGSIPLSSAHQLKPFSAIQPVQPESPALLTFTSGSTGIPKAAARTHGFLLAQHQAIRDALMLEARQVDLTTLPIFLLANLASGMTSVIPNIDLRFPGRIQAAPVIAQMRHVGVTRSAASPAFYQCLVDYCEREQVTLPDLRRIDTGGAPVFPTLLKRIQNMAPNADVYATYGSTEAEPMCHITYQAMSDRDIQAMREGKGLLTGHPVAAATIAILPDTFGTPIGPFTEEAFRQSQCPCEVIGEIVVSGAHVLEGYLHGQGDEETKFDVNGVRWHRTGDAGYFDTSGRLWLMGRCAARITDDIGGLYPFSVECAAQFIPNVTRSAMLSHDGERVLLLESSELLDVEKLRALFGWAHLSRVVQVHEIPVDKRHNAKIDYTRVYRLLNS